MDRRAPAEVEAASAPDPLRLEIDGLAYVLDRPPSKAGTKVVASVALAAGGGAAPLVDRVDLFGFRSRRAFACLVADAFGRALDVVLGHLAALLDQVERAVPAQERPGPVALTGARRDAAERLLGAPDLLDRAAGALEALGYVGEGRNRRLAYLVATSRLLLRPLSAILRAPSGAGKSTLLERVSALVPEESVEQLSRLTPHALYYLGADCLRHRLVLVDEQAGASEADYPIRTLQSQGYLRMKLVLKGRTETFTVHGPVSIMSGTTATDLDPENTSRVLELLLDDSPAQTRAVQEAQRRLWAGEARPGPDVALWRDAQRALEPMDVVVPFATRLSFPARTTRDRREQEKLLGLVASHALLHQRQRERDDEGRLVASVADYRAIFDLYWPMIEGQVEDLSPRAAALYRALARREGDATVSRRESAALLGWTYTTTRRALDELVAHEMVKLVEGDAPRRYRVLDGTAAVPGVTGLLHPDALEDPARAPTPAPRRRQTPRA
ncbi:MAG: hypothetical protein M9894_13685 [Planctomycetes bacterium]|nr:hypothetical protein [Planctomycetota bacterium]